MTVAVGDARARDAPALASTQTQGKIQPRESSLQPTSHHRARSPSDSGSDTTEAGDAANPIQRTPDARSDVVLLKDVAAGPKGIGRFAALAAGLLGERGGRLLFDDIVQRIAAIQLD